MSPGPAASRPASGWGESSPALTVRRWKWGTRSEAMSRTLHRASRDPVREGVVRPDPRLPRHATAGCPGCIAELPTSLQAARKLETISEPVGRLGSPSRVSHAACGARENPVGLAAAFVVERVAQWSSAACCPQTAWWSAARALPKVLGGVRVVALGSCPWRRPWGRLAVSLGCTESRPRVCVLKASKGGCRCAGAGAPGDWADLSELTPARTRRRTRRWRIRVGSTSWSARVDLSWVAPIGGGPAKVHAETVGLGEARDRRCG